MFFDIFKRKTAKEESQSGPKIYSVFISNAFNEEDRINAIFTVKYRSKLNESVIDEAIICKTEDGEFSLKDGFEKIREIITESIKNNLFLNATPSDNIETTGDEKKTIIELEEYLKQKIDCRQKY